MSTKPETMDAETLEALRGSIRKWEGIVAGTEEDLGHDNCALCQLFYKFDDPSTCVGCPVMAATGERYCEGTPYHDYRPGEEDRDGNVMSATALKAAAQAELDFLKSLLPTEAA